MRLTFIFGLALAFYEAPTGTSRATEPATSFLQEVAEYRTLTLSEFIQDVKYPGLVTAREIQLVNRSLSKIVFYARPSFQNSNWRRVEIAPSEAGLIPLENLWVAIGTVARESERLPEVSDLSLSANDASGVQREGYFVRRLRGGRRYEICMFQAAGLLDTWIVQQQNEGRCF